MNTFYKKNKLTPIINVSGFMTKIGSSLTNKKSIEAANNIIIGQLQNLTHLYIFVNQLTSLPESICYLNINWKLIQINY